MSDITTVAATDLVSASRTTINNNFQYLQQHFKSSTAPTSPLAGQMWLEDDNPSGTVWTLWIYDGAGWIEFARIDTTNNVMQLASGSKLTGALDANSFQIDNLANGTATGDAVNKGQVDARILIAPVSIDGISATVNLLLAAGSSASFIISDVKLISDTATTGSDGSNNYTFQIANVTAGNNLRSSAKSTNGADITANTVYALALDQNLTIAANDVLRLVVTKTGTPTSLSSAKIIVQINYKVTT